MRTLTISFGSSRNISSQTRLVAAGEKKLRDEPKECLGGGGGGRLGNVVPIKGKRCLLGPFYSCRDLVWKMRNAPTIGKDYISATLNRHTERNNRALK